MLQQLQLVCVTIGGGSATAAILPLSFATAIALASNTCALRHFGGYTADAFIPHSERVHVPLHS